MKYLFAIISSTQTFLLQTIAAHIATIHLDLSDAVNFQVGCDAAFSSMTRQNPGGMCGGMKGPDRDNIFQITWPIQVSNGTSASQMQQISSEINSDGTRMAFLPVDLQPRTVYMMFLNMQYPATPGVYTFQFGWTTNTGTVLSRPTVPVFLAAHATKWSGESCFVYYQSVIPYTTTEHFFLCPNRK